jgi:2,3,4,5-tetrahydropyridine-2-carboxylate N-succinyltransferase
LAAVSELTSPLSSVIDELWERRAELSPEDSAARAEVVAAVDEIDAGGARVAFVDRGTDTVVVDERAKRAILLAFRLLPMAESRAGDFRYHDRVPLKTRLDGVRVVPGAIARWGAYIAPGAELTPGEAPAWSVCVGGTRMRKFAGGEYGMPCLLMLRRLPEGNRHDKTELNAILRDHGANG